MWTHLPRTITALALLLGALATTAFGVFGDSDAQAITPAPAAPDVADVADVPVAAPEQPSTPPAVALVDIPADFDALITWAVGLFDAAELELPPLRFEHHGDDTDRCAGRDGRHIRRGDVNVIDLCTSEATFPTQVMVLHEIAHAWADRGLTDDREAAFQELRGYSHWRNYAEAAWHENGTEQAAEIVVWGLIDRPLAMARIGQNRCADLLEGFQTLTGADPLHGFTDYC